MFEQVSVVLIWVDNRVRGSLVDALAPSAGSRATIRGASKRGPVAALNAKGRGR